MHPVERLRALARAGPLEHAVLVGESAPALAALAGDPAGLVLSCRRLLQHHPASGPLRWLCARVLCSDDPRAEAWRCVEEIDHDLTAGRLAAELPEAARVVVLGWPEVAGPALADRGDVRVLVVDVPLDRGALVRCLRQAGGDAVEVEAEGLGAAVVSAGLVVLEAAAVGPAGFVAVPGARAAASVARCSGGTVWLIAGVGRALPSGQWAALESFLARLGGEEPWSTSHEVVPLDLVDVIVRPSGLVGPADIATTGADCPDAPELW